jgi:hypothetical protein
MSGKKKKANAKSKRTRSSVKKTSPTAAAVRVGEDSTAELCMSERLTPPVNPVELRAFLRELGIVVPVRALSERGSTSPFEYLCFTYFEGLRFDESGVSLGEAARTSPDCVVWANRGGGKTFLSAVATMLDLVFKPGIEVRTLGGSLEQSRRMHEHLRTLFEKPSLAGLVGERGVTDKRLKLLNRSRAEVLSQSQASVRGTRVQKVRCDEVELFDPEVWSAAQLVTRSMACAGPWGAVVRGSVEALSTMHRPMGLMWNVVQEASTTRGLSGGTLVMGGMGNANVNVNANVNANMNAEASMNADAHEDEKYRRRVLFRWGVVDALEHCDATRACAQCGLNDECAGRAKTRSVDEAGHVHIDDALRAKARVSVAQWESEMLCLRPSRSDTVYPEFDVAVHVMHERLEMPGGADDQAKALINDPLAPARVNAQGQVLRNFGPGALSNARLLCGMDFGLRSPTVVLWALLGSDGVLRVVDEMVASDRATGEHIDTILCSAWGEPEWVGVDPAGCNRSEQTKLSAVDLMRKAGLSVRAKRTTIEAGINLVRARLAPALFRTTARLGGVSTHAAAAESGDALADGVEGLGGAGGVGIGPRLFVHARCVKLIESLSRYRYDEENRENLEPRKDGSDHACDALRYLITNLDARSETRAGRYA